MTEKRLQNIAIYYCQRYVVSKSKLEDYLKQRVYREVKDSEARQELFDLIPDLSKKMADFGYVNDKDILRVQKSVEFPVVHFALDNEDIDGDILAGKELISVFSDDRDLLENFRKFRTYLQEDIDLNEPLARAIKALEHIHFNGSGLD